VRVLVLGGGGQVASAVVAAAPAHHQVVARTRAELDIGDEMAVKRALKETGVDWVVNAAAYTAVDAAENDESKAYAVNAEALALLADEAKRLDALVVHYSTDYVFDGTKRSPYNETDETNPLNVYGKSKLAGEQAIRASGASHLIIRTGWVYANRGRNFLLTILRLATEREELRIVRDQIGAPTCAADIAAATTKILTEMYTQDKSRTYMSSISGTYHMTAAGETSWHNFATAILGKAQSVSPEVPWFAAATQGRPLIAKRILPISSDEFRSPTRRPIYSVLSNSRLSEIFHIELPNWTAQLQCCLATEKINDALLRSASTPGS